MIDVFIDGGAGTTGLEIADRLAGRAELAARTLPADRRRDPAARADALNSADAVILCLPDDAAREAVALIDNPKVQVIDASTAHRTDPDWTYGFAEIEPDRRADLAVATRVSNPGCYPTGFLALVRPLVRAGLIAADLPITVHAVSGYSGGGKAMIAEFEEGDAATAHRAYALALGHKHVGEMAQHAGLNVAPLFTPAVARTYRGMLVEVPLHLSFLAEGVDASAVHGVLADSYADAPLIRVASLGDARRTIDIEQAAGTDRIDLFVFGDPATRQLRLIAALDNLGKGAAGAAVQNLNLMLELDETAGLRL